MNVAYIDEGLKIIERRLKRFTELREEFSRGDYHRLMDHKPKNIEEMNDYAYLIEHYGYELNDINSLRRQILSEELKIETPEDLRQEAIFLVNESPNLPYDPKNEDCFRKNKQRYIDFFRRCEVAERRYYTLILECKKEHSKRAKQRKK